MSVAPYDLFLYHLIKSIGTRIQVYTYKGMIMEGELRLVDQCQNILLRDGCLFSWTGVDSAMQCTHFENLSINKDDIACFHPGPIAPANTRDSPPLSFIGGALSSLSIDESANVKDAAATTTSDGDSHPIKGSDSPTSQGISMLTATTMQGGDLTLSRDGAMSDGANSSFIRSETPITSVDGGPPCMTTISNSAPDSGFTHQKDDSCFLCASSTSPPLQTDSLPTSSRPIYFYEDPCFAIWNPDSTNFLSSTVSKSTFREDDASKTLQQDAHPTSRTDAAPADAAPKTFQQCAPSTSRTAIDHMSNDDAHLRTFQRGAPPTPRIDAGPTDDAQKTFQKRAPFTSRIATGSNDDEKKTFQQRAPSISRTDAAPADAAQKTFQQCAPSTSSVAIDHKAKDDARQRTFRRGAPHKSRNVARPTSQYGEQRTFQQGAHSTSRTDAGPTDDAQKTFQKRAPFTSRAAPRPKLKYFPLRNFQSNAPTTFSFRRASRNKPRGDAHQADQSGSPSTSRRHSPHSDEFDDSFP